MKTDSDKLIMEALAFFNSLSGNDDVQDAKKLYKVLQALYNSQRNVSTDHLSVINEFASSISFLEQLPPGSTYTWNTVAKKITPLIAKKYNFGKKG